MNMCFEKVSNKEMVMLYRKTSPYNNKGFNDKNIISQVLKRSGISVTPVRAPLWSSRHEVIRILHRLIKGKEYYIIYNEEYQNGFDIGTDLDVSYHNADIQDLQNDSEFKIFYMNTWVNEFTGIIEEQVSLFLNKDTGTAVIYGFNKGVVDSFIVTTNPDEVKEIKEGFYIHRFLMQLNLAITT